MSAPQYSGTIEFPAKFIEGEIKELLAEHYEVRFKEPDPREQDHELELQDTVFDESEVKIVDGIFFFHDGEARYGEFYELEDLLVKKGVPFDRESGMDWNAPRRSAFTGRGHLPSTIPIRPRIAMMRWSALANSGSFWP